MGAPVITSESDAIYPLTREERNFYNGDRALVRLPVEFGLKENARVMKLGRDLRPLTEMDEATDEELDRAEDAANSLCLMVLVDPETDQAWDIERVKRVPVMERIGVTTAFFAQLNALISGSGSPR